MTDPEAPVALNGRERFLAAIGRGSPVSGALARYRVMANIVGVGLIILVFVGIPLQIAGDKIVVEVVGTIHGYLYIVYLLAGLDLVRRTKLSFGSMIAMVAAGLVPFVAFIVERKITARLTESSRVS